MPKKVAKKKVFKKKTVKNTRKVVIRTTHHQPIPQELSDTFNFQFAGTIPTGIVAAGSGKIYTLGLNNLIPAATYGPLYVGIGAQSFNTLTDYTAMGGTTYFSSSTHPTGLTSFIAASTVSSALFSRYTVTGLGYSITASPTSLGDQCLLVVAPDTPASTFSGTTTNSIVEMRQYPWAKSKICSGYNNQANNTLTGYIDVAKYMGVTRSVLMSDIIYSGQSLFGVACNTPIYTDQAGVHLAIALQCIDNLANTQPVGLQVTLKYYVTFREPCSKALTD